MANISRCSRLRTISLVLVLLAAAIPWIAAANLCDRVTWTTDSAIDDPLGGTMDIYYLAYSPDAWDSPGTYYETPTYEGQISDHENGIVVDWLRVWDDSEDACQWYDFGLCNGPFASFHVDLVPVDVGGNAYAARELLLPGPYDSGSMCEYYDVGEVGDQFVVFEGFLLWDRDWTVGGNPAESLEVVVYESDEGWWDDILATFTIDLTTSESFDVYADNDYIWLLVGDDDDGNGIADVHEILTVLTGTRQPYTDNDGDGLAEAPYSLSGSVLTLQEGDCDDFDPATFPGAPEVPYDGVDQDCDDRDLTDVDGDGYDAEVVGGIDCHDSDDDIHPGAQEIPYDGIDQDCDTFDLTDVDDDGFDAEIAGGIDCDDMDSGIHPAAVEIPYDGIDQDCDDFDLTDVDEDGYEAEVVGGLDCDDENADVYTGAPEVPYDGIDQDCDGFDLTDVDGDGHDSDEVDGSDCNDQDANVHPAAMEIPYNGVDDDCRWGDLTDVDRDGFDARVVGGDDCNDERADIHPGAPEVPYDGVDQDCDDRDVTDIDGDGFDSILASGTDCEDEDAAIHPGAPEIPYDFVDSDCDGLDPSDVDGDGHDAAQVGGDDCDDTDPLVVDCTYDGEDDWQADDAPADGPVLGCACWTESHSHRRTGRASLLFLVTACGFLLSYRRNARR